MRHGWLDFYSHAMNLGVLATRQTCESWLVSIFFALAILLQQMYAEKLDAQQLS